MCVVKSCGSAFATRHHHFNARLGDVIFAEAIWIGILTRHW